MSASCPGQGRAGSWRDALSAPSHERSMDMDVTSSYGPVLARALAHASDFLTRLDDAPVAATATPRALRARLNRPLCDEGTDPIAVIDDLVADCTGGIVGSAGGRFF